MADELSEYAKARGFTTEPGTWDRAKEVGGRYVDDFIGYVGGLWDTADTLAHGGTAPAEDIVDLAFGVAELPFGVGAAKSAVSPRGGFDPDRVNMFVPEQMAKPTERLLKRTAEELDADGVPMDEIWRRTGWFKPRTGGAWRTEVDDRGALLTGYSGPYKGAVVHDELLGRPDNEIFDYIDVKVDPKTTSGGDLLGYWDRLTRELGYDSATPEHLGGPLGTFLHESQHAVQSKYGFQPGSNPDYFLPALAKINEEGVNAHSRLRTQGKEMIDLPDSEFQGMHMLYQLAGDAKRIEGTAERLYKHNIGEIEAEDVTNRKDFTRDERRYRLPALLKSDGLSYNETDVDDILRYDLSNHPEFRDPLRDLAESGLLDDDFVQNYTYMLFE